MMALSARWQAPRECGVSIQGRGPGQKKDPLLTQQVGPAAGCVGLGGGCGCDPIPVHTVNWCLCQIRLPVEGQPKQQQCNSALPELIQANFFKSKQLATGHPRSEGWQFTETRASVSESEGQVEVVVVILAVTGLFSS